METSAQMHLVGTLPGGDTVFYADERFDNPGLQVWTGEKHVRFVPGPTDGKLRVEIENAINRHSAENGSNTPDFILAQFLVDALAAFDRATVRREEWYGRSLDAVSAGIERVLDAPNPAWHEDTPMMLDGVRHLLFMEGNITSDEKPFTVGLTRLERAKGEPARWTRDFATFDQAKAYFERQVSTGSAHPLVVTVSEGELPPRAFTRADPVIERHAREIYEGWSDQPGYVPWVENGNSTRQDDARRQAYSERDAKRAARAELDDQAPVVGEVRVTGGDKTEEPLGFDDASSIIGEGRRSIPKSHRGEGKNFVD